MLSAGADPVEVAFALFVAVTIGAYTLIDSQGSRSVDDPTYAFASFLATGVTVSAYGLARARPDLTASVRSRWRQYVVTGAMSVCVRRCWPPSARRRRATLPPAESSVLVAAFVGWRYLGEHDARRRVVAASIIVAGLVALVVSA